MTNPEINQPQLIFSKSLDYRPQAELMPYVFSWANQLPQSTEGIIDLAGGFGIEAKELIMNGFPCQAQDADPRMANNALVQVNLGYAESLSHYPPETFGGALLKDTLIALSPQQRKKMLKGLNEILVPNGSLLVISEILPEYGINYTTPGIHGCSNIGKKVKNISSLHSLHTKLIQDNATIQLIGYKSTPEGLRVLANKFGFKFQLIERYPVDHPLVLESRWNKTTGGFIVKLTKTS